MHRVHPGLAAGVLAVLGQALLLAVLDAVVGLRASVWVLALALQLLVTVLLSRGLARSGQTRLGPADRVTLVRSVLTCCVTGLVAVLLVDEQSTAAMAVTGLATPALALDAVDGWVARRTHTCTSLGARFDMEVDALLILALSLHVAPDLGWWVLLIGSARYVLLLAQQLWPSMQGPVRPRRWRKVVAATQGVVLLVAGTGRLSEPLAVVLLAAALTLLVASFGTEVVERRRDAAPAAPVEAPGARWGVVVTILSVAVVWVALAAPNGDRHLSPWLVTRVPLEGMALLVVVAVLPIRWAERVGLLFGMIAAVSVALKTVNVGFTLVLDRQFDLISDWFYFSSAVGVLSDSVGRRVADLAVVLVVALVVGLLVVLPLASRRVCRVARGHRAEAVGAAAALTTVSLLLSLAGIGPQPYHRSVSAASAGLVVQEAVSVRDDIHDHAVFGREIADDPIADSEGDGLLRRLRGKDVLLVFVESYGRSAIQDTDMAPGVDAVLEEGTRRLRAAGYRSRSGFLTSSTFGAASWLAHATTQSGLWVDSQRRYNQLVGSDRLTLSGAFHQAGWRTVFDVPSVTQGWSEGQDFYGFDELYGAGDVGYRGPMFGYATVPDQYTLAHFRTAELLPRPRKPVMAEIDLVSSHHPWAPLPRLVPWDLVGDGSVFDAMPEQGDTAEEVFSDPDLVRAAYGQSIEYSLQSMVSFLTTYPDPDLVVVMLGDHQPHHYVSGSDPGYDVPISVIAHDPRVMREIAGWGWAPGLRPPPDAPVWPMSDLRDRLLTAFSRTVP